MSIHQLLAVTGVASYDFVDPLKIEGLPNISSLVHDILASTAFKRLDSIRFLGGIDYAWVRSPNGATTNVRYTRGQHSLGVAKLALQYAKLAGLSGDEALAIFISALLHDIGHAPLSHSLEPVFKDEFGLGHHQATEEIVRGIAPVGKDLHSALMQHRIDIDRVIELMSGNSMGYGGFFGGPINFDTIEGISRSRVYGRTPISLIQPTAIVEAATNRATERDREVVDDFWRQKNDAYRYIINSRVGVLSDFVCQLFMRENLSKFSREDYFISEEAAFKKLPGLLQLLTSKNFEFEVWQLVKEPISYKSRLFYIDENFDFYSRDDVRRYKQGKESRVLEALQWEPGLIETAKDLFDDHSARRS